MWKEKHMDNKTWSFSTEISSSFFASSSRAMSIKWTKKSPCSFIVKVKQNAQISYPFPAHNKNKQKIISTSTWTHPMSKNEISADIRYQDVGLYSINNFKVCFNMFRTTKFIPNPRLLELLKNFIWLYVRKDTCIFYYHGSWDDWQLFRQHAKETDKI